MVELLDLGDLNRFADSSISDLTSDLAFIECSHAFTSIYEDGDNKENGIFSKIKKVLEKILEYIKKFVKGMIDRVHKVIEERKLKKEINELREKLKDNPNATIEAINLKAQIELLDNTSAQLIAELRKCKAKLSTKGYVPVWDAILLEKRKDKLIDEHNKKLDQLQHEKQQVPVKEVIEIYRMELENVHSGAGASINMYEKLIENTLKDIDRVVEARKKIDDRDYQGMSLFGIVLRKTWDFISHHKMLCISLAISIVTLGCAALGVASAINVAKDAGMSASAVLGATAVSNGVVAGNSVKNTLKDTSDFTRSAAEVIKKI